MMDNKCSKYEGLFIFSDEETLKQHISECEECRLEQEKMDKVSDLIGEVKFHYKNKSREYRKKMRAVCAAVCLVFFSATFGVMYTQSDLADSLMYGENLTAEEIGLPVDSYGLIMVDE